MNTNRLLIFLTDILRLEKWLPLQGERAHSLKEKKVFYIKSELNSLIFCSSFFLRLQGQPELCGCYHLLQYCFSFYVRLHGKLELFASDHLLYAVHRYRDAVHRYRDAVHRYRDTVHRCREAVHRYRDAIYI